MMQKLVLVPSEEWEKIKNSKIQVKQVTVSQPLQKIAAQKPQKIVNTPDMNQKGEGQTITSPLMMVKKKKKSKSIKLDSYTNVKNLNRAESLLRHIKETKIFHGIVKVNYNTEIKLYHFLT